MFKNQITVYCLLISLSFINLSNLSANATQDLPDTLPQPQVIVETSMGDPLTAIGAAVPEDRSRAYSFSYFTNHLGENTNVLNNKKYINKSKKQIKLNKKRYSLDTYSYHSNSNTRQSYLSINKIIIGYISKELYNVTHHQNKPFITSIRAMQRNHEYDNKVPQFRKGELIVYISEHEGYVEEYAFLELESDLFGKSVYLVLQAYYPKLLESHMKPNITDILLDYASVDR